MSPVLFDGKDLKERTVFWRYRKQKAARRGRWKLLVDKETEYLFDLKNDISETTNLVETRADITNELRGALAEWERDVPVVKAQKTT